MKWLWLLVRNNLGVGGDEAVKEIPPEPPLITWLRVGGWMHEGDNGRGEKQWDFESGVKVGSTVLANGLGFGWEEKSRMALKVLVCI